MKKSFGAQTLAVPTPVWVIGTYDDSGKPNVMTASWAGICSSKPPCVSVALRKATYTYGNIEKRSAFTVSIPSETHIKEADYFGLASGRDADKLEASGLTASRSTLVDAPYVEEFPLILECKLLQMVPIDLHTLFIGEIVDVKADQSVLRNGKIDYNLVKPAIFDPTSSSYFGSGRPLGQGFSIGVEITKK